jgi:ribosomal protein S18 acetylase RimI-like enzyme
VSELTTRPYRDADAEALADLMNAVAAAAGTHAYQTATNVRNDMSSGWVADPERDTRLLVAADGSVVAYAVVPTPPPGGARIEMVGGVQPDRQGEGLGRELMTWQIERAGQIRAAVAPDASWYLEAYAMDEETSAQRLFARFDLQQTRFFFDMEAPLSDEAAVELPEGLRSVPFTPDLTTALHSAHKEAFADLWGFQQRPQDLWVAMTVGSRTFRSDLSRIALDGDEIAGYVLAYDSVDDRIYVGQVGTRRAWRKRGVASALLSATMRAAAATGKTIASLGVDADSPTGAGAVYERLGFVVTARAASYRRYL